MEGQNIPIVHGKIFGKPIATCKAIGKESFGKSSTSRLKDPMCEPVKRMLTSMCQEWQ